MKKEILCDKIPTKDENLISEAQEKPEVLSLEVKVPNYDKGYKRICSVKEELLHFLKKYVNADWTKNLKEEDIHPCPNELILPDYDTRIPAVVPVLLYNGKRKWTAVT